MKICFRIIKHVKRPFIIGSLIIKSKDSPIFRRNIIASLLSRGEVTLDTNILYVHSLLVKNCSLLQFLGSSSSGNSPNLSSRNIAPAFNLIPGPYDPHNVPSYGSAHSTGSHPNIRHSSVPTSRAYASHLGGLNAGPAFPDSSSTGEIPQTIGPETKNCCIVKIVFILNLL